MASSGDDVCLHVDITLEVHASEEDLVPLLSKVWPDITASKIKIQVSNFDTKLDLFGEIWNWNTGQ